MAPGRLNARVRVRCPGELSKLTSILSLMVSRGSTWDIVSKGALGMTAQVVAVIEMTK